MPKVVLLALNAKGTSVKDRFFERREKRFWRHPDISVFPADRFEFWLLMDSKYTRTFLIAFLMCKLRYKSFEERREVSSTDSSAAKADGCFPGI
jgi:hypothetical protein